MLERQIVTNIQKYLKTKKAFVMKTADKFTSGIPDLIVIYDGHTIFMEVKRHDGVVSAIQHFFLQSIKDRGGHAFVVRSVDDVKKIIKSFDKLKD